MRLLVTTPTAIVADRQNVIAVRAEDTTGSFGILEGHADFLTALTVCVIAWRESDGIQRFCAVRHGVFSVRAGKEVAIATREALVGDDLDHLEGVVLGPLPPGRGGRTRVPNRKPGAANGRGPPDRPLSSAAPQRHVRRQAVNDEDSKPKLGRRGSGSRS